MEGLMEVRESYESGNYTELLITLLPMRKERKVLATFNFVKDVDENNLHIDVHHMHANLDMGAKDPIEWTTNQFEKEIQEAFQDVKHRFFVLK